MTFLTLSNLYILSFTTAHKYPAPLPPARVRGPDRLIGPVVDDAVPVILHDQHERPGARDTRVGRPEGAVTGGVCHQVSIPLHRQPPGPPRAQRVAPPEGIVPAMGCALPLTQHDISVALHHEPELPVFGYELLHLLLVFLAGEIGSWQVFRNGARSRMRRSVDPRQKCQVIPSAILSEERLSICISKLKHDTAGCSKRTGSTMRTRGRSRVTVLFALIKSV